MSRILILLLVFLFGFVGCQTTPPPLGNIFSPETTIPPPGTNSYTVNSAPSQETMNVSTPPPSGGEVSPFAPHRPYADPQGEAEITVQPFQAEATQVLSGPVEGSVKVAARTGDEIPIPVSAFRTDTGLYPNDSRESQAAGSATETTFVSPYQK